MKKIFILLISVSFLMTVDSCKRKQQGKKSHYTVYQAGQTGAGIIHSTQNMNVTLSPREMMLANIKTDTVRMESLSNQIILTGTTIFDPRQRNIISAWVSGQIKKMYVRNPGEYIRKGQKLYEIYSPELLSAEKDYLSAIKQQKLIKAASADLTATIKAMQQKLFRYGLTKAQIESLTRKGISDASVTIYSKAGGYLVGKMKEEGDYASEGDALFQLVSNNPLWVQAQLYDTEIPLLSQHPNIWVETNVLPGEKLSAHIVYDNPVMNNNSRVQEMNVSIDNPGGRLQPGMPAYVYLQTGKGNPVTVVPKSAVIYGEHHDYLWMQMPQSDSASALPGSTFMRMQVQLGKDNQTLVEILSGINPGDIIVSSGVYLLNSEYILTHGKSSMAGMAM